MQERLTRIYYSNPSLVVMDDPTNGNQPVIVLRHPGHPSEEEWKLIDRALTLCNMKLVNESNLRPDGLWYQSVKEVKDGEELCNPV